MVERVGLSAYFDLSKFRAGMHEYLRSMDEVRYVTAKVVHDLNGNPQIRRIWEPALDVSQGLAGQFGKVSAEATKLGAALDYTFKYMGEASQAAGAQMQQAVLPRLRTILDASDQVANKWGRIAGAITEPLIKVSDATANAIAAGTLRAGLGAVQMIEKIHQAQANAKILFQNIGSAASAAMTSAKNAVQPLSNALQSIGVLTKATLGQAFSQITQAGKTQFGNLASAFRENMALINSSARISGQAIATALNIHPDKVFAGLTQGVQNALRNAHMNFVLFAGRSIEPLGKVDDALSQIGNKIKAVFSNLNRMTGAGGTAGLRGNLSGMFGSLWTSLSSGLSGANRHIDTYRRSAKGAADDTQHWTLKLQAVSTAIGTLTGISLARLVNMLDQARRGIMQFAEDTLFAAARVEEMSVVTGVLADRFGVSSEEAIGAIDQMRKMGIRMEAAQRTVAEFIRYQMDMNDAIALGAVAQNAAVIANKDSTDTLEGLLNGILTYNSKTIRTNGIVVNLSNDVRRMADSMGYATEELTGQEKTQLALQAVLKEGIRIEGVYAETQEQSALKRARSLKRLVDNLQVVIGKPFLNAFGNLVDVATKFLVTMEELSQAGTPFYEFLLKVGAISGIVTEGLMNMTEGATRAATEFASTLGDKMMRVGEEALTWGVNIAVQLGEGLIEGATFAVVGAMDFIGRILAYWLAPGSPPRVAPDLDTWGAQAMSQWLGGFSQADYSVLEGIQAPLKRALDLFVDLGRLDEGAVGWGYLEISQQIMRSLAEYGYVAADVYETLRLATGEFGAEIVELATAQFDLAQTIDKVTAAEKRLAQAREDYADANTEIFETRQAYNAMLRAGASEADLRKKLVTLNKAEAKAADAERRIDQEEGKLDVLKETQSALESQVALQQKLIDQMLDLTAATVERNKALKEGRGAKDSAGDADRIIPELELGPAGGGFEKAIDEAFERMKAKIKLKLDEILQPLRAAWGEWQVKLGALGEALGSFFEDRLPDINRALAPFAHLWTSFGTFIQTHGSAIGSAFKRMIKPLLDLIAEKVGGGLRLVTQGIEGLATYLDEHGDEIADDIVGLMDAVGTLDFVKIGQTLFGGLKEIATKFQEWTEDKELREDLTAVGEKIAEFAVGGIMDFLGLRSTSDEVGDKAYEMLYAACEKIGEGVFGLGVALGKGLFRGMVKGLTGKSPEQNMTDALANARAEYEAQQTRLDEDKGTFGDWLKQAMRDYGTWYHKLPILGDDPVWGMPEPSMNWRDYMTPPPEAIEGLRETTRVAVEDGVGQAYLDAAHGPEFAAAMAEVKRQNALAAAELINRRMKMQDDPIFNYTAAETNKGRAKEIGYAAMQGLTDGVNEGYTTQVAPAASTAASGLISTFADNWQVRSPSLVMFKMGKNLMEGLKLGLLADWLAKVQPTLQMVRIGWNTIWQGVVGDTTLRMGEILAGIRGMVGGALSAISGKLGEFFTLGQGIIDGLIEGVRDRASRMVEAVVTAVRNALKGAQDALDAHSPSRVFMALGRDMMKGAEIGVRNGAGDLVRAVAQSMPRPIVRQPATAAGWMGGGGAQTINQAVNVNMGGVTIANGMQMAQFRGQVLQVVRQGIRGR
jgi:hypothetical protein